MNDKKETESLRPESYWYNTRTNRVEYGAQSLGVDRLGPFETEEEARRAPEIVAERAREWAEEEARAEEEDDW